MVERVTNALRAEILVGRMKPGLEFTQREVAARFSVSYIPVREALRTLEAEGLLLTSRSRGTRVAPVNAEECVAIFRLRRRIEPELAARAAVEHPSESLDSIERMLGACGDPLITREEHDELHQEVHLSLLRPAMTSWDRNLVQMLARASTRYGWLAYAGAGGHERHGYAAVHVEAHHDLVRSLRAGDAVAAREIMRRYLDTAGRAAVGALEVGYQSDHPE
ncbi:GntR family transcriptional regulator [Pseudonocardia spinosispora]|uniref:GntR family transcriptional regulator n=1 Tax=Pseudonocardia spinosispora TaxID=103441 RepID=UPI000409E512|nr:GntR family transcriptional regulator [Pseudonocardia spinosispora]